MRFDRLDNVNFPRHGWAADLELYDSMTSLGAVDAFDKWHARRRCGLLFRDGDDTARINFVAGGKIGSNPLPAYDQFQWGGFLKQSGYATGQLVGSSLQYGQLVYFHRIVRGGTLRRRLRRGVARSRKVRQPSGAGQSERSC